MKADNALTELKSRLPLKDFDIENFAVGEGVEAMLDFYRDLRIEDIVASSDTLFVKWNTVERAYGAQFEFEITRQFIPANDAAQQLSLSFSFEATEQLRALGSNSRRCETPDELDAFATFVRSSPAYIAVSDRRDGMILLAAEAAP
jgi:hypothetical protein